MSNSTTPSLALTHELATVLLNTDIHTLNGVEDFKANPRDFIKAYFGHTLVDDMDISIVDNDANTLNLCLPYYDGLEEAKARMLDDTDTEDVAGGEIFIIAVPLLIAGGVALGITAAVKHSEPPTVVQEVDPELAALQAEEAALAGQLIMLQMEIYQANK